VIVPPDGYWAKVQEITRRNGILLIHDEVFTGFGRTGKVFAHQHWDTEPDIVTFAKTIGGGIPLGGFIATEEVSRTFGEGDHFTTFGSNNQIGLAAGHAVLDIIDREDLPGRADVYGQRFLESLQKFEKQYEFIGDVRGRGLMLGMEIVRDKQSRIPAPVIAKIIQAEMRERGVILGITGNYGCVLRMTPPLVISQNQIDQALAALAEVLERI
jgi:4-aminobutyrate aminotransferase-like enzyme